MPFPGTLNAPPAGSPPGSGSLSSRPNTTRNGVASYERGREPEPEARGDASVRGSGEHVGRQEDGRPGGGALRPPLHFPVLHLRKGGGERLQLAGTDRRGEDGNSDPDGVEGPRIPRNHPEPEARPGGGEEPLHPLPDLHAGKSPGAEGAGRRLLPGDRRGGRPSPHVPPLLRPPGHRETQRMPGAGATTP